MKNMKNKTDAEKEFILKKYTKKWITDNKEMIADYQELCEKLLMFRASWGIEIGIIFNNPKEIKGRGLGFKKRL